MTQIILLSCIHKVTTPTWSTQLHKTVHGLNVPQLFPFDSNYFFDVTQTISVQPHVVPTRVRDLGLTHPSLGLRPKVIYILELDLRMEGEELKEQVFFPFTQDGVPRQLFDLCADFGDPTRPYFSHEIGNNGYSSGSNVFTIRSLRVSYYYVILWVVHSILITSHEYTTLRRS